MTKQPRIILTLTGGLGNQLFQLAAALSTREYSGEPIGLDWGIGRPRLNGAGVPEIASFSLPQGVALLPKRKFSVLASKSNGYLLRMGFAPTTFERVSIIRTVIFSIGNLISTIYFRSKRESCVCNNLGYAPIVVPKKPFVLIGYFQSYFYSKSSGVKNDLLAIKPINTHRILDDLSRLSIEETPLVVHFRFGDYKSEPAFGIPSSKYYADSISELWKSGNYKKIWVFSDEIELAKEKFPQSYLPFVRWIEEIGNSAVLTLEAMRLGHGFVIANSSFSFWGAFLSYKGDSAKVIAPEPWFQGTESPNQLIPPHWSRIQA